MDSSGREGLWLGGGPARNHVLISARVVEGVCEAEKILLVFSYYWLYTDSFPFKFSPLHNLMDSVFRLLTASPNAAYSLRVPNRGPTRG